MSDSIWSDGGRIQMPQYEKLTRIKKVDVTIVGGGLCGLLCAYFLKEAGVECLLLEGSRIGSGTVRHAMAQVTSQHGLIYSRLLETLGEEKARMYFEANELALHKYRELIVILRREVPIFIQEQTKNALRGKCVQPVFLV